MRTLLALLWAKQRIAVHLLASVRHESRLKVAVVSSAAVLFWLGIFAFSHLCLGAAHRFGEDLLGQGAASLGNLLAARLLATFALALLVMLVFSNVLIAFTTLYRSREVAFLVPTPISVPVLFLGRFAECVSFSSWASLYLGSAMLLAYGFSTGAPWLYYAVLPAFSLPFVVLPAALGALLCLFFVRFLSRLEQRHVIACGLMLGACLFVYFRGQLRMPDLTETSSLQALLSALGQAQSPFLPSFWLAEGLLGAALGEVREAAFYLLLLCANALFATWLAVEAAGAWFLRGWTNLAGAAETRPRGGVRQWAWRWLDPLLRPLPSPLAALVAKDLKLFWRDPAQWSQFLLFFGIMALYVANLGSARSVAAQPFWRSWAALLNTTACMLILSTLTTRFIYPLVSLEGRRLWILGLAPLPLRQIVWQKLWLSVGTTAIFTVGLALASAWALDLDWHLRLLSVASVAATTFALSGLAVGLGSLYPNFQEDNPARIVSGLGGTLNFLLSVLYVVLVTIAQAALFHWSRLEPHLPPGAHPWVTLVVVVWIGGLTLATWLVPMKLGLRHLEQLEP